MSFESNVIRLKAFTKLPAYFGSKGLTIGDVSVVERWELPVQRALAKRAQHSQRILEVGYGLGMAAKEVRHLTKAMHWIIEAHPEVFKFATSAFQDCSNTFIINGFWEDKLRSFDNNFFDCVLFDAYPVNSHQFSGKLDETVNFVADFLPSVSKIVSYNGTVSFIDFSLRAHTSARLQNIAKKYFRCINVFRVFVQIPGFCTYASGSYSHIITLRK